VDLASLWKVMMTLVSGRSSRYFLEKKRIIEKLIYNRNMSIENI